MKLVASFGSGSIYFVRAVMSQIDGLSGIGSKKLLNVLQLSRDTS